MLILFSYTSLGLFYYYFLFLLVAMGLKKGTVGL
jgi:hypothetical protein